MEVDEDDFAGSIHDPPDPHTGHGRANRRFSLVPRHAYLSIPDAYLSFFHDKTRVCYD